MLICSFVAKSIKTPIEFGDYLCFFWYSHITFRVDVFCKILYTFRDGVHSDHFFQISCIFIASMQMLSIFFLIFIFYMIILCDFLSCVLRLNELGGPKKRGSRTNFSILRILAELLFDLI